MLITHHTGVVMIQVWKLMQAVQEMVQLLQLPWMKPASMLLMNCLTFSQVSQLEKSWNWLHYLATVQACGITFDRQLKTHVGSRST